MKVIALIRQLIGPDIRDEERRTISLWFNEIFSNARRPPELPVDPFATSDGMIEQKVKQWYDEEFQRGVLLGEATLLIRIAQKKFGILWVRISFCGDMIQLYQQLAAD